MSELTIYGGACNNYEYYCQITTKNFFKPNSFHSHLGFRLTKKLKI